MGDQIQSFSAQILMAPEAEAYIDALKSFSVQDVASLAWFYQHERVEKLNMQAVANASANEDEYVKESLVSLRKIPVLVRDLISVEVWKQNVFPLITKMDLEIHSSFPLYMVLHHEATVANLLETVLFHKDCCEALEDTVVDMVDYCYRKIVYLISEYPQGNMEDLEETANKVMTRTALQDLERQNRVLEFEICLKVLAILRYFTDHLDVLPFSVMHRLLSIHDVPILLISLLESAPWVRRTRERTEKFINGKWYEVSSQDRFKLTKVEGQIWITLLHLLLDTECMQKYELNDYKKNRLLKIRPMLSEVILDQMPPLRELCRYLDQMAFADPPPGKRDLILEQIPEIYDKLLLQINGKEDKIATKQLPYFTSKNREFLETQAKLWADTYNLDVLESFLPDPPKCAVCGMEAAHRCSRCQNEWYCRRECQVQHWPKHKKACDLIRGEGDAKQSNNRSA